MSTLCKKLCHFSHLGKENLRVSLTDPDKNSVDQRHFQHKSHATMAKGKKTTAAPKAAEPKTEEVKKGSGRFSFCSRAAALASAVWRRFQLDGRKQIDCSSCTHVFLHVMSSSGLLYSHLVSGTGPWHSSYQGLLPGYEGISPLAFQCLLWRGTPDRLSTHGIWHIWWSISIVWAIDALLGMALAYVDTKTMCSLSSPYSPSPNFPIHQQSLRR